jgi:ribose 5-phosphate isomerase B
VAVGSDHGGRDFKALILAHLKQRGFRTVDLGVPYEVERADYPDIAIKAVKLILSGGADLGVLICGTGVGMSLTANRFKGIRAANCTNELMAALTRAHNDANILTLGQRLIGPELALAILNAFLNTSFDGGRHQERLALFDQVLGQEIDR